MEQLPGGFSRRFTTPGRGFEIRSPLLIAITLALLVRLVLLFFYSLDTGLPAAALVDGHDGAGYIRFAWALASGSLEAVSADARRHDPGLPLYLAAWVRSAPGNLIAFSGALFPLFPALALFHGILRRHSPLDARQAALLVIALPLVYPTQVYFSCFVMTEPLFLFLLLAAVWLSLEKSTAAACLVVGLASLVRSPGLLLAPALVAADLMGRRTGGGPRTWIRIWPLLLAALPPLLWMAVARSAWGATQLGVHRPGFGLPFSGFAGLREVGLVRAAYVLAAVAFFLFAAGMLLREAAGAGWKSPFLNAVSGFCVLFLLFHLCLKTLFYVDRSIYTFNYQDRYYVGLLPFALYACRSWLRPWNVALLALVSFALSAWWGHNYFPARGL